MNLGVWNLPGNVLWCDIAGGTRFFADEIQERESHPVSTLEMVTEGVMLAEYRGIHTRLEPGDVIFLKEGEPHRLLPGEQNQAYKKLFVTITGSGAEQIIQMCWGKHFLFSIRDEQFKKVLEDFRKLIMLLEKKESPSEVSSTLFHLILEMAASLPQEIDIELLETIKYMKSHLANRITENDLARQVGISKGKLQQLFQQNLQTTLSKYFLKLRMEKAADLLQNTSLSIKEIGSQVGYGSGLTFSREFKKYFAVLPKNFREKKS